MNTKGFTIVELVVSVAIFAFMTSFLMAKYGSFNQSVLLTNLAYDVALTIRNAQSYGLNVKSKPTTNAGYTQGATYAEVAAGYQYAYGVHFEADANGATEASKKMIFFADSSPKNIKYDVGEEIATYTLRNGSYVSEICRKAIESDPCIGNKDYVDISFKRPDPDAIFFHNNDNTPFTFVQITLKTTSGATKSVIVRKTGQIAVLQNN